MENGGRQRKRFQMNVVGYKGYIVPQTGMNVQAFQMNVVGYKADSDTGTDPGTIVQFQMNVVGYKGVTETSPLASGNTGFR